MVDERHQIHCSKAPTKRTRVMDVLDPILTTIRAAVDRARLPVLALDGLREFAKEAITDVRRIAASSRRTNCGTSFDNSRTYARTGS